MENKKYNQFSLLKFPNISYPVLVLGAVFLFIVGFVFFLEQIFWPLCCDAKNYLEFAKKINTDGIASMTNPWRTFAYPWILSLIIKMSGIINLPESILIFLVQISAYYLALVIISNVAQEHSKKLSAAIYLALCMNIFVIPYTGVILTDSLYTSLAFVLFGGMMKIESLQKSNDSIHSKWIFLGILLLSLAIVIRPAALGLVLPVFYCLLRLLWMRKINILGVLPAVLLGAIPLYIQIVMNVTNHKMVTFLPAIDLGTIQIKFGIQVIKFGTWRGNGHIYPSNALITYAENLNLSWYFHNLIDAAKLLTYKFIGAFDFDYLVPYPYYKALWLPSFFSFTILWVGMFGLCVHLFTQKLVLLGSRFMPLMIFIGWCSTAMLTGMEVRFAFPLITYFIIVGCVTINYIIVDKNRKFLSAMVIGWVLIMPIFFHVAKFIRLHSIFA